jgi:hypothetical protein
LTFLRETLTQYIHLMGGGGVCTLELSGLFQGGSITAVYNADSPFVMSAGITFVVSNYTVYTLPKVHSKTVQFTIFLVMAMAIKIPGTLQP